MPEVNKSRGTSNRKILRFEVQFLFVLVFTASVLRADPLPSVSTSTSTSIPAPDPYSFVPAPIKALLNQEYPGWKFAPATEEVKLELVHHHATHPPYFLKADFDGDGKPDYAVQIVHGKPGREEQNVIAYIVHDGAYEEMLLQSFGPNSSVYLWSIKQQDGGGLFTKDRLIIMGGELGETSYEYENGKFQEVSSVGETY